MKWIQCRALSWIGASACTVYPIGVLVHPDYYPPRPWLSAHEGTHWRQQRAWWLRAGPLGLLAWYGLYLLALPVWWNRWRRAWESEAMRIEGRSEAQIAEALRGAPYWLR